MGIDLIKKVSLNTLQNIAFCLLFAWIIFPIVMMIFNLAGMATLISYNVWFTTFYFVGVLAWLLILPFVTKIFVSQTITKKQFVISLLPMILLIVFLVWVFICDLNAQFAVLAFFSYSTMHDGFFGYVAYGGFIVLGIILSTNREKLLKIARTFLSVALFQAIIALMNNDVTRRLCDNSLSSTPNYEAVFFNSNHYAYYLLFCILVSAFMFFNSNTMLKRILYLLLESLFTVLLTVNNTFGSHLAVLITLVFCFIWSLISKENYKREILIVLAVYIAASLVTLVFSSEIIENYKGLAIAIKTLLFDNGTIMDESVDQIGSGRGLLWNYTLEIAKQNPIFGIGGQNVHLGAHNIFIQIASYFGFVGLGLYVLVFIVGIVRLFKARKSLTPIQKASAFMVIAYLISGFFGVTMFYTAPYFYFILGICMSGALKEIDINELQKVSV